ncbi:MAG: aminotransferase [Flavobacteriales bacterium]|nr:aminotransferase [Flavobacteriales bacterium]
MKELKYLLLQARKAGDPMIKQELNCFQKALKCSEKNINSIDLIRDEVSLSSFEKVDAVIIGGSGDYSIAHGGSWMNRVLDIMNYLYNNSKITFASCWGFQAMAKARGGSVVHDLNRAELGTIKLQVTDAGKKDIIFKELPINFFAQMGHEDIVEKLPKDAILLASSKKVKNEAFCFKNRPIYCTQFHPEMDKKDIRERMEIYPSYVEKILGITNKEFIQKRCFDTKDTDTLILNFINHYLGYN